MTGRWFMLTLSAALPLALVACDHTPEGLEDDAPEKMVQRDKEAATQPVSKPAIELGDPLSSLQKRADGGDLSAMVALGRAHEALAHKAEAKKWYEKAAAKGDESAKEALRMMEAQAAVATRAAEEELAATTRRAAEAAAAQASVTSASTRPAANPTSTAPAIVNNGGDVTWQEVIASIDTTDFVTVSRPGYRNPKKPNDPPIFVGLTTAPDKTITVAASGPVGDKLNACSMVLRIRNRQNIERNTRVEQAATVAKTITHGNVSKQELAAWISNYLMNGAKTEPTFRNGWSIVVSGTAGEGINDPKKYLGEAVLIEMKK
jgi:hypothetical protein